LFVVRIGEAINTTVDSATWVLSNQTEGAIPTRVSMISRCFACGGRIAASLPSTGVTDAILSLSTWDHGVNATSASFVRAMAGETWDDELPADYPPSIVTNGGQMITRVSNWLGGSQRPYMIYHATSPASDPLLYLHLTFVDKLMNKWLTKHDKSMSDAAHDMTHDITSGNGASICTAPLLPLITNEQLYTHHHTSLGYQYDS
jgi:hypothetical protein